MDFKVEEIAALARLEIEAGEKEKLGQDLGRILEYIRKLDKLDTEDVIPTSHVLDLENVYREDEVKPSAVRDEAIRYAPSHEGHYFKVPKVVEK